MNRLFLIVTFIVVVAFGVVWSDTAVSPVEQCPGEHFEGLKERIQVKPCGKSRCKLRQGTNITVNFKFKPKNEVKTLTNVVTGNIAGLPLPFIGVDGTSACAQIVRAEDDKPARCPLQAGQEYVYTNVFPVEPFYPTVAVRVHWALNDGHSNVICFEVPSVITGANKKN